MQKVEFAEVERVNNGRVVLPDVQGRIPWSMPIYWNKHNIIHFVAFKLPKYQMHIAINYILPNEQIFDTIYNRICNTEITSKKVP